MRGFFKSAHRASGVLLKAREKLLVDMVRGTFISGVNRPPSRTGETCCCELESEVIGGTESVNARPDDHVGAVMGPGHQ